MRPTLNYSPATRLRFTRVQLLGALNRTGGLWDFRRIALRAPGAPADQAVSFGRRIALTIGLATVCSGAVTPIIEWAADQIPEKRMGVHGIGLILIGFSLQSVQYWLSLLDVRVR
jgi:hypothetical protein